MLSLLLLLWLLLLLLSSLSCCLLFFYFFSSGCVVVVSGGDHCSVCHLLLLLLLALPSCRWWFCVFVCVEYESCRLLCHAHIFLSPTHHASARTRPFNYNYNRPPTIAPSRLFFCWFGFASVHRTAWRRRAASRSPPRSSGDTRLCSWVPRRALSLP